MVCRSPTQVIRTIESLAHKVDVVSFDVFDTLLRRRIMPPEKIKIRAAKAVSHLLAEKGVEVSISEALDRRQMVERKLYAAAHRAGNDPECHINDVVSMWLEIFLAPSDAAECVEQVISEEIEAEKSVCYAVDGMTEAVQKIRNLGKKVLFVSDMYLGEDHIAYLLEECGYCGLYDKLYVSSEYKMSKRSGRLFKLMLEECQLSVKRWVHFGDNRIIDIRPPKKLGGRSYRFWPKDHAVRVTRFRRLDRLEKANSKWTAVSLLESCQGHEDQMLLNDLIYTVGHWIFGPVLANFIHQVLERASREDIELMLFPAEQGSSLREIFLKLSPYLKGKGKVPVSYCFLNGRANYLPQVDHIGLNEIREATSSTSQPTVRTLLNRLNFEPTDFVELVIQHGLSSLDFEIVSLHAQEKFLRFLRKPEVVRFINERQRESRELLKQYLGQMGFWQAGRAAVVGVGSWDRFQLGLTRAFSERPEWPYLFGFYMAHVPDPQITDESKSTYEGILYHHRKHPEAFYEIARSIRLLESLLRDPDSEVDKLDRDAIDGKIVPICNENEASQRENRSNQRELLSRIQEGVHDFAKAYGEFMPFMEHPLNVYSPFLLNLFNRFMRLQSGNEPHIYKNMYHEEDLRLDDLYLNRLEHKGSWSIRYLLANCRTRLFLPQTTIACLTLPGLATFYNCYQKLRTRIF